MFNIPVVLIIFRRSDTLERIVNRLREVKPNKVYLLGDQGRNDTEIKEVEYCRNLVESLIDWPCEVIKNYAESNRGVYKNIGEGARWVFEREEKAIFIEDDNLPELSFFRYAEELLQKYENEPKVAWICGTNYFTDIESNYSYCFTQHLLPCGWASWSHKFLEVYDGTLDSFENKKLKRIFRKSYRNKFLMLYQQQLISNERYKYNMTGTFVSWDYQMLWSIRSKNLYGIMPLKNQITNIGVDEFSIHGGVDNNSIMTGRFCEIKSLPLEFPLKHPNSIDIEAEIEDKIGNIILPPIKFTFRQIISKQIKRFLHKDLSLSWNEILKRKNK